MRRRSRPSPLVTDIRGDLALFDCRVRAARPATAGRHQPRRSAWPWLAGTEEVEDAEIVHAIAPDAAIRVILIGGWGTGGPEAVITAVDGVLRLAVSQGSVVSLSAILGEDCFTPAQVTA